MKEAESMKNHEVAFAIILSSAASAVSFIVVLWVCICCYRGKKDSEDADQDSLQDVSQFHDDVAGQKQEREDVKQLNKHPWQDSSQKSPFLTRKSIKFERPADKRFVTENVQPDQYSQSSLNRSLGVKGPDGVLPNSRHAGDSNSLAPSRGSDGGSTSSSPFHRVLSQDSDSGAAAAADEAVSMEEPEYARCSEKLGRIQFNLTYDFQEMTLTLRIIRAVDLPAKDFSGTSDPYVKIMLLPDKKHKLSTNIKRKNLNPRWNELFAFEGFPYSKLMSRTLYMQVLDYDRFSRDDPIGEVCMPLSDVDLAQGQTMWRSLQPCKGHTGKLGELLLSLCYQPTVGRITVVVMKARELKAKDINGLSDPYVKIWLTHEGKKVEKKKTTIKEKNLNPVFNESFIFNVPYEQIRRSALSISVVDYDRLGRNELIGQVVLGSKSGPMEVKHWNEMFAKSRQPVAQWHILKDFG